MGDSWNYVNDLGQWQNYTVEAVEAFNEHRTFRVLAARSEPDRLGLSQTTAWIDTDTLGVVAFRGQDGFQCVFNPPTGQSFPMVNRTYNVAMDCPGYRTTGEEEHKVHGWASIKTPAGTFAAVKTQNHDKNTDLISSTWFAPSVGNRVLIEDDHPYRLAAWRYAAAD